VVTDLLLVGGLVGCITVAAGLAIAEVSILRVRRTQIVPSGSGDPRADRLIRLLDDLPIVLNVVLLSVLLVQVGAATISAVLADRWFGGGGVPVMSLVLTLLLFIGGEAVPKTRAVQDPHRSALRVATGLGLVVSFFRRPVALILRVVTPAREGAEQSDVVSEAELRLLAHRSAAVGEIEPADVTLMERSFRFGDLQVRHVMVPRDRIRYMHERETAEIGFGRALAYGHRRLPVVRGDLDHVVGIVRLRDLASAGVRPPDEDPIGAIAARQDAGSLMAPALHCSPRDPLAKVLASMQEAGQWLAVVVVTDEEGLASRTVGLITIEDIVAELVGEIADDRISFRNE
jgi:CBS domain containing-hemolysin-like protein